MRALVVYESMYGNTHLVADEIAAGLRGSFDVTVVPVEGATADAVADADLVVVGGPTHVHGMSSARTREAALEAAKKDEHLEVDPDAEGPGLREWFDTIGRVDSTAAAAFDTRLDSSPLLTGRASRGIQRRLRKHGFRTIVDAESFLVDKQTELLPGEPERARAWGETIASAMAERTATGS